MEEMLIIWLQRVFDKLVEFNVTLDPAKLQICKEQIMYLGFNLNKNGHSPSTENVNKINKFPVPTNRNQVQSYLGIINYFRHLIFDFAKIVQLIINLTRKKVKFIRSNECQKAFLKIQDILLTNPTLKNFDDSKDVFLATDASMIAICGILMQKHENK